MSLLLREALGGSIRRARNERRRTLRDVSRSASVSLGYLSEIERGRKEPSSELLAAICDALALPLPELLDDVADTLRPGARRPVPAVDPALRSAVEEAFSDADAADAAASASSDAEAAAASASDGASGVRHPARAAGARRPRHAEHRGASRARGRRARRRRSRDRRDAGPPRGPAHPVPADSAKVVGAAA